MKRALLALALSAGCETVEPDVELVAITPAPPASTANVDNYTDNDIYTISLSVGVAMAVRCWDNCGDDYEATSCTNLKLTSAESTQLGIFPLYRVGAYEQTEFVLVGREATSTALHVETDCASRDYSVTVVP